MLRCDAERLLTWRKQGCYLRLSAHLGFLLACFLDGFVLGKYKESLWEFLSLGIRWGEPCMSEQLLCSFGHA